jgi:adenylosuccinate synthase
MNPRASNLIGSGVVVHVPSFFEELDDLAKNGLENVRERIFISDRCHVVCDLHIKVDGLEEQELRGNLIGTTKRGIGPCYATKAARSGIRISDVFSKELFDRKIRELARGYKLRFGASLDDYDVESEISKFNVSAATEPLLHVLMACQGYRTELAQYVIDAVPFMASAQKQDVEMVLEGANALLLGKSSYACSDESAANFPTDLDFGTFPYVTSSNTGLGGM